MVLAWLFNWRFWNNILLSNIDHSWSNFEVLGLAIINGLLTSIILETIILLKQMDFYSSLKTALGMSFISMLGMEIAMNVTDLILTGGAMLTWWVIPIMLMAGFYTSTFNYWRLKNIMLAVIKVYLHPRDVAQ